MQKSLNLAKYLSARVGHCVQLRDAAQTPVCLRPAEFSATDFSGFKQLKKPSELYLLGGGCNVLISPDVRELAMLGAEFNFIKRLDERLFEVGAATPTGKLVQFCREHDLAGAEFLAQIPGLIGGCVRGNAGLAGVEISGIFAGYNGGKPLEFCYRNSNCSELIKSARFVLGAGFSEQRAREFAQMRANQPRGASFGSCFKNPPQAASSREFAAGALLERCALKGARRGGAGFSDKHANFLLNYGGASFDDMLGLIFTARRRVFEQTGIMLEPEVQIFF